MVTCLMDATQRRTSLKKTLPLSITSQARVHYYGAARDTYPGKLESPAKRRKNFNNLLNYLEGKDVIENDNPAVAAQNRANNPQSGILTADAQDQKPEDQK